MKLKNSRSNMPLSKLVPLAYFSILLLSVMRCLQLVKYIDSNTGFFNGGSWLKILLYGILFVVCLVFVIYSFLSAEGKKVELVAVKDKFAGATGIAFALSLIFDSFESTGDALLIFKDLSVGYFVNKAEFFKMLMSSGALPYAMQGIFAVFSVIYVVVLANSFLKGDKNAHNHKIIALAPIGWAAFKMITRFVKQISYIKVSDLFLELIMLGFMITFFVALSQVVSGVYSDDTRWRITALGFSSAVVSLAINIPRLILTLFASGYVNVEYPFSPDDALFGLFAFAVSVAAVKSVAEQKESD